MSRIGKYTVFVLSIYLITFVISCDTFAPDEPDDMDILDGPVEGLSFEQQRLFLAGDNAFGVIFTPSTGLGPVFVTNSCGTCHPGDGRGHPSTSLVRFGRFQNGVFNHLLDLGGPQLQNRSIPGFSPELVPNEATGVTTLTPPPVTGLGFLEAVLDEDILEMARSQRLDGEGISGVPNYISPPDFFKPLPTNIPLNGRYIGRFGKKASALNLLHQTVNAYLQDIGITTDFALEDIFNPVAGNQAVDNIPDPEVPASTVHNVVFYLRTLKAPIPRNQENPDVLRGKELFVEIGCGSCHSPTLITGPSDIAVLSNQTFHPYTDLLLHDMGAALDDLYTEGTALTSEWRTPPLWGIGLAVDAQGGEMFLMHDGRARTFEEAIILHGGEAANSEILFSFLNDTDKSRIIKFLESL